jgi:hypothetical protein
MCVDLNFVCVGGMKCGTTWLSSVLREHPEISVSTNKEPCYFSENYEKGQQWYKLCWSSTKGIKGEFTAHYLYKKYCLERLYNDYPRVKIIVLLRNPWERTLSHYKMVRRNNELSVTSIKDLEPSIIHRSLYCEYLKNIFNIFDSDNIKICYYDDIIDKPIELIGDICKFLEVNTDSIPNNINRKYGKGFIPKYIIMDRIRSALHDMLLKKQMYGLILFIKKTGITNLYKNIISINKSNYDLPINFFKESNIMILNDLINIKFENLLHNDRYINKWLAQYFVKKNERNDEQSKLNIS